VVTATLAEHMASSAQRELPAEVVEKTALHILDTVAAMVSGTRLEGGVQALKWVAQQGGRPDALVVGSECRSSAADAALANGMLAHADETDDSHALSLTHPGCAIVPAALAVGDWRDVSGQALIRAVTVGYDVGPRISMALGAASFFDDHHSSHSVGGLFGATAAVSSLMGFSARQCEYMLSYAVQQASGNACWRRDPDHVEKAYDFGGMPAHHAVLAGTMVASGMTGSRQPIEGTPGLLAAYPKHARPALATEALGTRYEVMRTAIKKWCVGSPIQSALDSLLYLMQNEGLRHEQVDRIVVSLPVQSAPVVDRREMPAVNLQFQLSVLLLDGHLSFDSGHNQARMHEAVVLDLCDRIQIDPRPEQAFIDNSRQAIVTVHCRDGSIKSHHTLHVRGTPANPMTLSEIQVKAQDLMAPVLGTERSQQLISQLIQLNELPHISVLRPLLKPAFSLSR